MRWAPRSAARARASGRGSTATTLCGRGRAEDLHGQVARALRPRSRVPCTPRSAPPAAERIAWYAVSPASASGASTVAGTPSAATKWRSSGSRTYVRQSTVATQSAPDPALEGDAVVVLTAPAVVALAAGPDTVHHAVPTDQSEPSAASPTATTRPATSWPRVSGRS